MKKVLLFFVSASLAVFGTSCSSDDSSGSEQSKLVLTSNILDVMVGESVSFNVTADGKTESGAELYIDSDKITNPHVFETEGTYDVIAKKQGFGNSNNVKITVIASNTDNGVVGKWIPKNISVTAMGNEVLNENYPHKATCDEDYFEFKNDSKVELGIHDDGCVVTTSGADWSIQGNILKFNVMDYDITTTVVSNTATKLVITANGTQFEPLVPILIPDVDPSLLALLPLANITITLEK